MTVLSMASMNLIRLEMILEEISKQRVARQISKSFENETKESKRAFKSVLFLVC